MKNNLWRICATVLLLLVWGFLSSMFTAEAALQLGQAAGKQFEDSNQAYREVVAMKNFFNGGELPAGILLVVLLGVWWKPLTKVLSAKGGGGKLGLLMLFGALSVFGTPRSAQAYYDTKNLPEFIEIGPNETAFYVPANGENKKGQAKFGSAQYLEENKVAAKRMEILHVLIRNPGFTSDVYVPAGKVVLVDRTPYQREWSRSTSKGTSAKDEGFHLESSDSLSIKADISIAAFVKEEDAAKFLYWFGYDQVGTSSDNAIKFASVAHSRSLAQVMDGLVRGKVQALLSKEFGSRKLRDGYAQKTAIIAAVEAGLKEEFTAKGITFSFVGFASDLTFDPEIQQVINDVFVVGLKYENREAYAVALDIKKKEADIGWINALSITVQKWNGTLNLPSFMMLPEGLMHTITGWFGGDKQVSAPTRK